MQYIQLNLIYRLQQQIGKMVDQKQLMHYYFVEGLVNSEFQHFGGEQCYNEIPFHYHLVVCSFFALLHICFTYKWKDQAVDKKIQIKKIPSNLLQKICIYLGYACLLYTIYRKIVRRQGLFLFNPCHIALIMQLILMQGDNSSLWMRRIHTAWSGWLFGPLGALLIPHLEGLSLLQIIVFFAEHLIVLPFGPLIMARRYGFLRPNFKNQAIAYGSIIIYHLIFLVPLCRTFKVNVNFVLCHSPAQPFYEPFGYHYFFFQILNLNLIGYLLRWISYVSVKWLTSTQGLVKFSKNHNDLNSLIYCLLRFEVYISIIDNVHFDKFVQYYKRNLMTTITNFLQGNFIANPQSKTIERPIWVLNGTSHHNLRVLVNHFVNRCTQDKKPLIHLDFGISTLRKITQKSHFMTSESGLKYAKLDIDSASYIVYSRIQERIKAGFLIDTLNKLSHDICHSHILRKDKDKVSAIEGWGLVIEGFQAFTVLNKKQNSQQVDIQNFISNLSNLPPLFRQVVIITNPTYLPDQINFGLERLSTCLTKVIKFSNDSWQCISTVRRFTGYFKQEHYNIVLKEGRVKVSKVKNIKNQQKTSQQMQMLSGLGFKVQKDEQSHRQQKQLREMIFPHLKQRKVCDTGSCQTGCACIEKPIEDLIILDEQQEDDQDLDV